MNTHVSRLLYWSPRVLGVLFAGFLGMFALDVFDEGLGFWQTVVALAIHLIPAAIVLAAVLMGWSGAGGSRADGGVGIGLRDPIFGSLAVGVVHCGAGFCSRFAILPKLAWHAESYPIGSPG